MEASWNVRKRVGSRFCFSRMGKNKNKNKKIENTLSVFIL